MSDTETPFDAGDANSVNQRAKDAKRRDRERAAVMGAIMETTPGRSWLWHLLASCRCFATTFDPNPVVMAYHEGERNVGLRLLAEIHRTSPEQYLQMIKENSV